MKPWNYSVSLPKLIASMVPGDSYPPVFAFLRASHVRSCLSENSRGFARLFVPVVFYISSVNLSRWKNEILPVILRVRNAWAPVDTLAIKLPPREITRLSPCPVWTKRPAVDFTLL